MLIEPPSPGPESIDVLMDIAVEEGEYVRIRAYLDVPSWKCPLCKLVNFGRNLKCADVKCAGVPRTMHL